METDSNNNVVKNNEPISNNKWVYVIIIMILFFLIIGLIVWIIYIYYKKPIANTNIISFTIYGIVYKQGICVNMSDTDNIAGIIGQTDSTNKLSTILPGSMTLVPTSNINNLLTQWYIIPTDKPNYVIIQNVASKGYMNINNLLITIQSDITNATPILWSITEQDNINYFEYFTTTKVNSCSEGLYYIVYDDSSKAILTSCVKTGVINQWWYTNPATAHIIPK